MKTLNSMKLASLMVVSSVSLMACGDTEDYYLEPGYGHNWQQAETVQLAQVANNGVAQHAWLVDNEPSPQPLLIHALEEQHRNAGLEKAFKLNELSDEEIIEVALEGDPIEATPPLNAPNSTQIEDMTPAELGRTCTAINSMFDGVDSTDMNTASCTAHRLDNVRTAQNDDRSTCNAKMTKCIDTAPDFIQPAIFCQTPHKVPTECEIDYVEITTCLRTFKESQAQLEAMDICEEDAVISIEADEQFAKHQAAQACLIKLDTHCPTFL